MHSFAGLHPLALSFVGAVCRGLAAQRSAGEFNVAHHIRTQSCMHAP